MDIRACCGKQTKKSGTKQLVIPLKDRRTKQKKIREALQCNSEEWDLIADVRKVVTGVLESKGFEATKSNIAQLRVVVWNIFSYILFLSIFLVPVN